MNFCCQVCGSKRTIDNREPAVCYFLCYWLLDGWLGWNAKDKVVAVRDQRALIFIPSNKSSVVMSYPKMVATARMMGWKGKESVVGTFPPKPRRVLCFT